MEIRLKLIRHHLFACGLITVGPLAFGACGSTDPTNISIIYNITYSLEIEGFENEVTSIFWTASDGSETEVQKPASDWTKELLGFSGDRIGLRVEGSVSRGEIRIRMVASSPGVPGTNISDGCSDDVGILQTCNVTLPPVTLP